jgi:hypothetical protein
MHQISQVVRTKAMLMQAIHIWRMNDFFFAFHFAARVVPMVLLTLIVPIDNKASELKQLLNSMSREFPHFESCCRTSALLATLSYTERLPLP